MIQVNFTPNIQRHVTCPPTTVRGGTVREVLDCVFSENERARGYVLDERGALRQHMMVFLNGRPIRDRAALSDPVRESDELYVMQALSGG